MIYVSHVGWMGAGREWAPRLLQQTPLYTFLGLRPDGSSCCLQNITANTKLRRYFLFFKCCFQVSCSGPGHLPNDKMIYIVGKFQWYNQSQCQNIMLFSDFSKPAKSQFSQHLVWNFATKMRCEISHTFKYLAQFSLKRVTQVSKRWRTSLASLIEENPQNSTLVLKIY